MMASSLKMMRPHTRQTCAKSLSARSLAKDKWLPKNNGPHLNPLNYYFWAEVQTKVFKGRREPVKDLKELETQIQTVWEAASNQDKLHNSFQGSWLL